MTEVYKKLNDWEHVRSRIEMYYGSKELFKKNILHFNDKVLGYSEREYSPALITVLRELIDNSMDEFLLCRKEKINKVFSLKVNFDEEKNEISVEDNGRGVPIHEIKELGKGPAASILLSELRTGRNFGQRDQTAGLNGIGAAGCNFVSEYFKLEIQRDNNFFTQEWYEKNKVHYTNGPKITKKVSKSTGTKITFKPSNIIFENSKYDKNFIKERLWDIAVTNPDIKIYFNDKHLKPNDIKNPIGSTYFNNIPINTFNINFENFKFECFITITDDVDISHSIVNNIPTYGQGTEIDNFKNIFYNGLISYMNKKYKKEDLTFKKDDFSGMLFFTVTNIKDAKFDSQSKTKLITNTNNYFKDYEIDNDLKKFIKNSEAWLDSVYQKCKERLDKKDLLEIKKQQKKLEKNKVLTLKDANGKDRNKCVLFLAEGLSAIQGVCGARNPEIHGGVGLRGKILNVMNENDKDVVNNKVLFDIMSSIGLKIGEKPVNLRYGKVYIACDADDDGYNITALLVSFFYKYWKDLFNGDKPYFHVFLTPLIIMSKGKERKYIYDDDYDDFKIRLDKNEYKDYKIIRAKGLARLTNDDWKKLINEPNLIPLKDDDNLKDILGLIFDENRIDDRKKWLKDEY